MGKQSRLHKQAVIEGRELPFRQEYKLHCKHCGKWDGPESEARQHIRECWGYPIKDDEPIPPEPIIGDKTVDHSPT